MPNIFSPTVYSAVKTRTSKSAGWDQWVLKAPYYSPYPQQHNVYVKLPAGYISSNTYRVLYILQPMCGTVQGIFSGKNVVNSLNLSALANVILVYVDWSNERLNPWYITSDDCTCAQDLFMLSTVTMMTDNYSIVAGRQGHCLVGFSKSGWGALSLLLLNPTVFGYAACWDVPWLATFTGIDYSQVSTAQTASAYNAYNPLTILPANVAAVNDKTRIVLGGGVVFMADHTAMKTALGSASVGYVESVSDMSGTLSQHNNYGQYLYHNWNTAPGDPSGASASGWCATMIPALMAL